MITLTEKLKGRNTLEAVGGITYLTQLMNIVPTTHNIEHYVKIVEEKSLLRKLIKSSSDIMSKCYDNPEDPGEVIEQAEKSVFDISLSRSTRGFVPIKQILTSILTELKNYI